MDCGKQLGIAARSHGTKRCQPCFAATRKISRPLCVDCGKQLRKIRSVRCRGCQTRHACTGRRMSEEQKEKIRQSLSGRHPTEETRVKLRGRIQSKEAREKNRIANSGANNARWKGGLMSARNIMEGSAEYKAWRKAVFERDNYTCYLCRTRGGYLHAHHILGFSKHPELRLIVSNGLTLCKPCHLTVHRRTIMRATPKIWLEGEL
jgi:hypothetical protein